MSDLKRSIVIVNEYTVKPKGGGKGSRGSSPGNYVTRYMARDLATETLAPIRRTPIEDFAVRYMARESATERASSVSEVKGEMKRAQGDGGVAFGYGQLSLSDLSLKAAAKDVQRLYDEGHTVLKTVFSFDQEYLREHGIIEKDFVCERRGDYRGNIDQMKLRMGVMNGMRRMAGEYDDLRYIAVIQVDTEHVHCHIAAVDAGTGRITPDGTQKGKIDERSKAMFRRGLDAFLDEKQSVKHLSSAVGYEKRNVTTFVKRWTHHQMLKESLPQFLLACLPEDRSLWRAGTNDKRMRKPNAIVNQMVEEMLSRPDSPMGVAMATVQDYANTRRENEGLTQPQWNQLVRQGRSEIVDGSVNSVYALLRALPKDALRIRTPMLDAMSMDFEEMAEIANRGKQVGASEADEADPMVDFGFKLRSYSSRREHHKSKRAECHEQVRTWDQADIVGRAVEASRVLRDFYEEEERYHAMCMAKYQRFLPFTEQSDGWYEKWVEVADFGSRVLSVEMMARDDSLRKLKDPDEAEQRGLAVYAQRGGSLMTQGDAGKQTLLGRAERMRQTYARRVEDLRVDLAGRGLKLVVTDVDPDEISTDDYVLASAAASGADGAAAAPGPALRLGPTASIEPGREYEFDEVKGLDMHQMRYDFATDVPIGERARTAFVQMSRRRSEALDAAVSYLVRSGQPNVVGTLPVADIESMAEFAKGLEQQGAVLPSRIAELARQAESEAVLRRSRTVNLGIDVAEQIEEVLAAESREAVARLVPVEFRAARRAAGPELGAERHGEGLE